MSATFPMDPAALAEAIDIPVNQWPGNCHGIALAVRDLVPVDGMRIARGHWHGFVSRNSVYRPGPSQQHSWLVCSDGRILDPTRWAMTSPSEPFIYLGINDDYDEGARQLRARPNVPFPGAVDPYARIVGRMDEADRAELARFLGAGSSSSRNLGFILQCAVKDDPVRLDDAEGLFRLLEATGNKAVIPLDSWQLVMEPETLFCRSGSNRTFTLPDAPKLGEAEILFEIFNRFLAIEERPEIEQELEEFGYRLERDLWASLNRFADLKDMEIAHLPSRMCDTISVIAGELLGKGFGAEMKVERFAASMGVDARGLNDLLQKFGRRSGYELGWTVPDKKARAPEMAYG